MEHIEIERKFTLKSLPADLETYPCQTIEQAYLNIAPVVRVRQSGDKYTLTYKGAGMMAHEEYNLPLDKPSYQHLLAKADGNIITKKRYRIPLENPQFDQERYLPFPAPQLTIELDIFDPPFAPLIMAEIEFNSQEMADAFIPPEWFDQDVTLNPAYHNSAMSQQKF